MHDTAGSRLCTRILAKSPERLDSCRLIDWLRSAGRTGRTGRANACPWQKDRLLSTAGTRGACAQALIIRRRTEKRLPRVGGWLREGCGKPVVTRYLQGQPSHTPHYCRAMTQRHLQVGVLDHTTSRRFKLAVLDSQLRRQLADESESTQALTRKHGPSLGTAVEPRQLHSLPPCCSCTIRPRHAMQSVVNPNDRSACSAAGRDIRVGVHGCMPNKSCPAVQWQPGHTQAGRVLDCQADTVKDFTQTLCDT